MTIQDLLRSPDPANIKLAAIIATTEQFHEAVLGLMECIGGGANPDGVRYSSENADLFLFISSKDGFLSYRPNRRPVYLCVFSVSMQGNLADYFQDLDKHLRKFTSTIQKRLSQMP